MVEIDLSWMGAPVAAPEVSFLHPKGEEDEKVQGSQAWLRWRGKGLGSSDAAALLGVSPWTDIHQLLEEKLGRLKREFGPGQRSAMQRGKDLEPEIRDWYERGAGARFKEDTEEHPEVPYLRASYDGINRTYVNPDGSVGKIIEIKAPNKKDHALAKEGEVPEKYYAQVQWLMMVARLPWCTYVSYGSDDTYATVEVKADPAMQAELKSRAATFWRHVETKTEIPEWSKWERDWDRELDQMILLPSDPVGASHLVPINPTQEQIEIMKEHPQVEEGSVEALVAEALRAREEADAAEARYEAVKGRLKAIAEGKDEVVMGEAVFGYQTRKGPVDYGSIPELIGLNLDQYRKPDVKAFYFKRKKGQ